MISLLETVDESQVSDIYQDAENQSIVLR